MDIYVTNIPLNIVKEDLLIQFHHIIHRPPFSTDPLLNFDVFLPRVQRNSQGTPNKRWAILTLPSINDGYLFLTGRLLNAKKSRNQKPRETTLARIRGEPWQDPEAIKQERKREAEASVSTVALNMSFGRVRRDGTFTIEYSFMGKIHCDLSKRRLVATVTSTSTDTRSASIGSSTSTDLPDISTNLSDITTRSLDISVNSFDISSLIESLRPTGTPSLLTFWYNSSALLAAVRSNSSGNELHELFLEFSNPATFEMSQGSGSNQRLSGFSGRSSMPLGSQHLRIVFPQVDDLLQFVTRARSIQFPYPRFANVTTVATRTYGSHKLKPLSTFLESLPFPLAFQVEKSVWDGAIDPDELYAPNMRDAIQKIRQDHPDLAANIFLYFVSTLRVPTFRDPPRPPPRQRPEPPDESLSKSARRRRRRRNRRRELALAPSSASTDLHEQLARSAAAYVADAQRPKRRYASSPNPALYEAFHISITPSTQVLQGPLPDLSNEYQTCFLRVGFADEDGGKPRRDNNLSIDQLLESRYRPILLNGVDVGGRHFEFLGYSMSSLKDYTFIFVTPFAWQGEQMNAEKIRKRFGNIPKASKRPALLGARWGQMFSASTPSVLLTKSQLLLIPDRTSLGATGQNALFTDGCSTIAPNLARTVARRVLRSSLRVIPSCFQFRMGGAKGVLFQDPNLGGNVMCLRPSQTKFDSEDLHLDITLTSARPLALFLNRPLIALLEHHGVQLHNFIRLQDLAIDDTLRIKSSLMQAATSFAQHGLGASFHLESLFKDVAQILHLEIAQQGSDAADHPTVQLAILKIAIVHGMTHILREIKHRGRIRVPGSYTLLGVSDEWNCLEEGEIFAQVYDPRTQENVPIEGRIIITRSPQIHPGDIQFVRAVHRPQLDHLKNVVVFSCKGERSLPSMLGGGDLDGELSKPSSTTLHPPKNFTSEAGAYEPLAPTITPHICGIADVVDFVINFIRSDLLGYISTTHLRISDLHGLDCKDCLRLAEAASHAVDFPKVGTAVDFKSLPRAPDGPRPDYLSGEGFRPRPGDDRYYPSVKVLGKLFRRVPTEEYEPEEIDWTSPIDFDTVEDALGRAVSRCMRRLRSSRFGAFSAMLEMDQDDEVIEEMHHVFEDYREQLLIIAKTHTTSKEADAHLTEAELVSGAIMERYSDPKRRREVTSAMNLQTQELTRKIRLEFTHRDNDDGDDPDEDDDGWFDAIDYEEDPDVSRLCNRFNRARAAWIAAREVIEQDVEIFGVQSFLMIALGSMLGAIKALGREAM
ncbi:RNA dependent RNA polymerase-domain-containing protein [Rhodocollybia butyracea]|uniref:RNA-dependent RNA polymerase n=1 Tax=Rhodocollybia butyracea TaxID=206335 RepID=A0A9P5UGF2_9AGAR|nr:RNA dependent RNA polymerase-domain-containing protein [Rhodocollybia butyracea]